MTKLIKIRSVKELRKHLELTQQELAVKLGVGQPVISAWENDVHDPSLAIYKKLHKLAKSKGVVLEIE